MLDEEGMKESFERRFGSNLAQLRGTEQEIVVFKSMALQWFREGWECGVRQVRGYAMEMVQKLDDDHRRTKEF